MSLRWVALSVLSSALRIYNPSGVKIQILSDLHNEFLRNDKPHIQHLWGGSIPATDADVVILAGDIDTGAQGMAWAIAESVRLAKPVIYVLGNHEFYHQEYAGLKHKIELLSHDTNVHYLDCNVYVLNEVRFIGATLWTDYEADAHTPRDLAMLTIDRSLADHRVIKYKSGAANRKFRPSDALALHQAERHWIEAQLSIPFAGKTVVVTHHGPHAVCQHPNFPVGELSGAFHSDLSDLIEEHDIALWIYGHTHANLDVDVANTRIFSNQAGYPGENAAGFDASQLVEI